MDLMLEAPPVCGLVCLGKIDFCCCELGNFIGYLSLIKSPVRTILKPAMNRVQ